MDRGFRHRALLSTAIAALPVLVGGLRGQSPVPPPSVAVTATPWVQAVPPPTASPAKPANAPVKASSPTPMPTPSVASSAAPSREDLAKIMARKREEELAREKSVFVKPQPPRGGAQLSPEEREAYSRNLNLWQTMPPEEQQTIRSLAAEGMQEEIRKSYESSGLTLNEDQKEVFALRYKQERRRLEREIQQKAKAERARRLPEIMDRLKREFGPAASPSPSPAKL